MARGLLAVTEMQRVFAEPDSPWATPRCAGAAAGVARLVPDFGDRVVLTRFLAPPGLPLARLLRVVALRPPAPGRRPCGGLRRSSQP
ncbi:hypothetical protein HEK131_27360 [Streptomyces seoulensis]|nr:hypothetical protein HEK131_27360 [Streptomyces seoulensis]